MKNLRTLCWKELRENFKWALLAGVIVSGAMLYALRIRDNGYFGEDEASLLCSKSFLLVTDFGFLLVGLLLGFVQILTELKRDQWAFLVHRPLTMNTIFFGKVLPGAMLYLLATLVPLLMMAWWISTPGVRPAPFDWNMLWPGLVDVVVGLGFYFAALWSGIMRGSWYGRRALPLLAAYYALKMSGTEYVMLRNAWDVTIVTVSALFLAAWAGYRAAGSFRKKPLWGKAATVLTVLLALGLLVSWLFEVCDWLFPSQREESRSYAITNQGELVLRINGRYGVEFIETLDGKKLTPPEGRSSFVRDDFLGFSYGRLKPVKWEPRKPWFLRRGYEGYRNERALGQMVYNNIPGEQWYYVLKKRQFWGYNLNSRRVFGYFGPNGFGTVPAQAGAFASNDGWRGYWDRSEVWADSDTVYRINLDERQIRKLFKSADGERLLDVRQIYSRNGDEFRDSLEVIS